MQFIVSCYDRAIKADPKLEPYPNSLKWDMQYLVEILREVAEGKDPRTVFQDQPKRGKGVRSPMMAQLCCGEVLRLVAEYRLTELEARRLVATEFSMELRTVTRHLANWRARFGERAALRTYQHNIAALVDRTKKSRKR